jgi:hypothetical protein
MVVVQSSDGLVLVLFLAIDEAPNLAIWLIQSSLRTILLPL